MELSGPAEECYGHQGTAESSSDKKTPTEAEESECMQTYANNLCILQPLILKNISIELGIITDRTLPANGKNENFTKIMYTGGH